MIHVFMGGFFFVAFFFIQFPLLANIKMDAESPFFFNRLPPIHVENTLKKKTKIEGEETQIDSIRPLFSADLSSKKKAEMSPSLFGVHERQTIKGITIGPIENAYHPGKGYGSEAYESMLGKVVEMGANWVALTPFGRVADLSGSGIDLSFEMPFEQNVKNVALAIKKAHDFGLKVMLVPHLWVESAEWRALINPKTEEAWAHWIKQYRRFVLAWANVASQNKVDLFSAGVELRFWVTSAKAPSFLELIREIRAQYKGPVTYSANWDDVENTVILGQLDVIGINAFYPLTSREKASSSELYEGGKQVRDKLSKLAKIWEKPVLFTEMGYTTRPDPALHPWEWPDSMNHPKVDEKAQAKAYDGLLSPIVDEPDFLGFFVWRVYADPYDVSQEAEWGFSPKGKKAEAVLRRLFGKSWQ